MKKKGLLKGLLLIVAGLFVLQGQAQNGHAQDGQGQDKLPQDVSAPDSFAYRAPLDTISQAGFYRIILTPQLVAKCQENMADIRIHSGNGSYIPYVLKTDFPIAQGESFIEFPILPAKKEDSAGDVRIGNWSGGAIDSLLLYMNETAADRNWTLSGSNDGEKWFAIREHIQVPPSFVSDQPYQVVAINFPKSNYHYFRIAQENKGVLPLHIFRAGIRALHAGVQRYRPTPPPVITQKDSSDHHSYIYLSFPEPYVVENMQFYIRSPRLYNREVHLLTKEEPFVHARFNVVPTALTFEIAPVKSTSILLDIDNEDNAPLVVEKVETSQKERYLLTWLEPGTYELLVGDKHALAPKYDLGYFVDTVSQEPAAIMPGIITSTNVHPSTPAVKPHDNKAIYLWTAIVAVLILLVWLCLNMLKSIREPRQ